MDLLYLISMGGSSNGPISLCNFAASEQRQISQQSSTALETKTLLPRGEDFHFPTTEIRKNNKENFQR
jgi:hypothetical protein